MTMSPVASSTSTTVVSSGYNMSPSNGIDGRNGMNGATTVNGKNGTNGHILGGSGPPHRDGGGKQPLMHIDDAVRVTVDLDPNAPVEAVLKYGEACLERSLFLRDMGRPDLALKEYVKASYSVLDVLPRNKGWATFFGDRKGFRMRYNDLMARISVNHEEFEKIKAIIKEDNSRTGVQPAAHQPSSSGGGAATRASRGQTKLESAPAPTENGYAVESGRPHASGLAIAAATTATAAANAASDAASYRLSSDTPRSSMSSQRSAQTPPRAKPTIHPKPQALHGNAIKPGAGNAAGTSKTAQDLAARFASLRTGQQPPVQDPRIRTQPIELPPSPPAPVQQEPPPHTRPQISLAHILPDLPKVPEAIYSPARGTVSSQAAQLPSSTPRGMFSRTNSTTSFSGIAPRPPPADDYFSSAYSTADQSSVRPRSAPRATIPEGDTVTVQELLGFMQAGSRDIRVLLIDVRGREAYDEGHIMSQSTICIEPEVLERSHISASDILDSMILAPEAEKRLFEKRHDFDLVVFYDQGSERISPGSGSTPAEAVLVSLFSALAHYDFQADGEGGKGKTPKLLKGGIEAWVHVMGEGSLQTTSTAGEKRRPAAKPLGPRPMLTRPRTRYITKPIQDAAEAKQWEESLKDMETSSIVRTTDDFLRRFPPVSPIQESMSSPALSSRVSMTTASPFASPPPQANLYSSIPTPPARPPPTVPRHSHSGLEETDEDDHYIRTKLAKAAVVSSTHRQTVGLYNPGNWCYGNSSFQSLFASGGFGDELMTGQWASNWKVPMKSDEKINHPQLLAKMLANFFHWMQNGKFGAMKAKTVMEYCKHIHSRDFDGRLKTDSSTIFGGSDQQDAQEFISFLITNLHDETNRLRDRPSEVNQPELGPRSTPLSNGLRYWAEYRKCNDSLVDKYWRGVQVAERRCRNCGLPSLTYDVFDALHLPVLNSSQTTTIIDLLNSYHSTEVLEGYKCDRCGHTGTTEKREKLVRLPDLLCIAFRRFEGTYSGATKKNNTAVAFPITGLDMTSYSVQAEERPTINAAADPQAAALLSGDAQFRPPFVYDCYAVIVHSGTLKSGHYRAYVKDDGAADPYAWHHFDDAHVEPVQVGSGDGRDVARRLYKDGSAASAYVVFYKRRKDLVEVN